MRRTPLRRFTPLRATGPIKSKRKPRGVDPETYTAVVLRDRGCVGARLIATVQCAGRIDPHHIIRRSQGGPDTAENLVSLCRAHHSWVHEHVEQSLALELLKRSWEAQ